MGSVHGRRRPEAIVKRYIVRAGKTPGMGLYLRASGCMCTHCIDWVEDRDDASKFVSRRPWPTMLSAREGGRVVRLRTTEAPTQEKP